MTLETMESPAPDTETEPIDAAALEPSEVSGEEIEADPETLEALLVGDSAALQRALIAILFLEPEPMTPARIAQALGVSEATVEQGLLAAQVRLVDEGINLISGAGTWRVGTNPAVASVLEKYFKKARRRRLSRAMLETLAIIACRGPVTRAQVEDIRQVNSDGVIARCLDLEFIEVAGQKETPGRPLLYGITSEFLRYFGLGSIEELHDFLPADWARVPTQQLLDLQDASPNAEDVNESAASDESAAET